MAAVAHTPIEIWQKIFEHLLYERSVVDPDPFSGDNSLHMSLIDWHDVARLRKVEKQRNILRLVSKRFKQLADSIINRYIEIQGRCRGRDSGLETQLVRCTRLHLDVKQPKCKCVGMRLCYRDRYCIPDMKEISRRRLMNGLSFGLFRLPPDASLPVKIVAISSSYFEELMGYVKYLGNKGLFSSVKALIIPDHTTQATSIPALFPSLTYLNIHPDPYSYTPLPTVTEWPTLTTLVIHVCHSSALHAVALWRMPVLRHVEMTVTSSTQDTVEAMQAFLNRGWPSLRSLRIYTEDSPFFIRERFWDNLPNLEYCAFPRLVHPTIHPPDWHPLHTVGIYDSNRHVNPRMTLLAILYNWKNVKTIAELHHWDDVPPTYYKYTCDPLNLFSHPHIGPSCYRCIMDTTSICRDLGVRHEDRSGRTLDEFLSYKGTVRT